MDGLQSIVCTVGQNSFIPSQNGPKFPCGEEVQKVTGEQKEKIVRFRRMGRSYAEIGKEIGVSKDTVKSFCRRNKLTSAELLVIDDTDRCRECGAEIEQRPKRKKGYSAVKPAGRNGGRSIPARSGRRRSMNSFAPGVGNHSRPMGTAIGNTAPTNAISGTDSGGKVVTVASVLKRRCYECT